MLHPVNNPTNRGKKAKKEIGVLKITLLPNKMNKHTSNKNSNTETTTDISSRANHIHNNTNF